MKDFLLGILLMAFFAVCYYFVCRAERYFEKLKNARIKQRRL